MEVPRHWRMKKQRYAMVGEICPDCRSPVFPPRAVCPYCEENKRQLGVYIQQGAVLAYSESMPVAESQA